MPLLRCFVSLLLLVALAAPTWAEAKKKILLVGQGPDGHPPATHEYLPGLRILAKCLEKVPDAEVTVVEVVDAWKQGPELLARADGVVLFLAEGAKWMQANPARHQALKQVAQRKGGLSVIHWGMGTREAAPIADWLKLFGGCHGGPDRKYIVAETQAELPDPAHPIVRGLQPFKVKDEFYYRLKFVQPEGSIKPLLRVTLEGRPETVSWAWERPDGGRSFGFSGLHFHANWGLPAYRRLVAQGVLWSVQLPIPKDGLAVDIKDADLQLPPAK